MVEILLDVLRFLLMIYNAYRAYRLHQKEKELIALVEKFNQSLKSENAKPD